MVPKNRFELPTFRLQGDCTTVVLHGQSLASFSVVAAPFKVLFMPSTGIEPASAFPAFYQINYKDIWLRV